MKKLQTDTMYILTRYNYKNVTYYDNHDWET
jgi:hypothetical protein